jgi:hypothetical protein
MLGKFLRLREDFVGAKSVVGSYAVWRGRWRKSNTRTLLFLALVNVIDYISFGQKSILPSKWSQNHKIAAISLTRASSFITNRRNFIAR